MERTFFGRTNVDWKRTRCKSKAGLLRAHRIFESDVALRGGHYCAAGPGSGNGIGGLMKARVF
jgi:hypothetical protein